MILIDSRIGSRELAPYIQRMGVKSETTQLEFGPNRDLLGTSVGELKVVEFVGRVRSRAFYRCVCKCDKEILTRGDRLKSKRALSCGCSRIKSLTTHGDYNSPEYTSWRSMKRRCLAPNAANYRLYGGRGIMVCKRWINSYRLFLKDMGRKPSPQYTLDRIDVNGNYCPTNCRWATQDQQHANRRNTIK